jgi:hypothetical protein
MISRTRKMEVLTVPRLLTAMIALLLGLAMYAVWCEVRAVISGNLCCLSRVKLAEDRDGICPFSGSTKVAQMQMPCSCCYWMLD